LLVTDTQTISWSLDPAATAHDMFRGFVPAGSSYVDNYICQGEVATPGTTFLDATQPTTPGELFYYLVSAHNACGSSGVGNSSAGPRPDGGACTE